MIVFPMMGLSQRFKNVGYKSPKYKLYINNNTIFYNVLLGFFKYFNKENFLFIVPKDDIEFIYKELKKLGIYTNFYIQEVLEYTEGQADTVYKGLKLLNNKSLDLSEQLLIYNIDTIRKNIEIPLEINNYDGFLEVFYSPSGNNWSFIKSELEFLPIGKVLETAEKIKISNLASSGLYGFRNISLFLEFFEKAKGRELKVRNEYYIAPIYNLLIEENYNIGYFTTNNDNFISVGTPLEYISLIEKIQRKLGV